MSICRDDEGRYDDMTRINITKDSSRGFRLLSFVMCTALMLWEHLCALSWWRNVCFLSGGMVIPLVVCS